ncbi:MAG: phosphatidate cytidylyltransferase [Rhodobacter sp.]|nr:phosphatidate cytidylyltransferase [Rhodobacter sp.]
MALDLTVMALTCLVLLAAGYGSVLTLMLFPKTRPGAAEALAILHTEALIVVTAVAAVWLGGWVLAAALIALALRVGHEAASVAGGARFAGPLLAATVVALALLPLDLLLWPALAALALAWLAVSRPRSPATAPQHVLTLAAFPGLPLVLFVAAGFQDLGAWLLAAFFLVETFDSYALLGGKILGRTKAFPVLSPKKTVEGLAAGAVMLMLTAALVGYLLFGAPVLASAGFALYVGVLALAGDLAASRLKRQGGVKDYPPILRLQGGLLDITDAWIAAGAGVTALAVLAGWA